MSRVWNDTKDATPTEIIDAFITLIRFQQQIAGRKNEIYPELVDIDLLIDPHRTSKDPTQQWVTLINERQYKISDVFLEID
jgi:hypothetical protein